MQPTLLTEITLNEAQRCIASPDFAMQQKLDGRRLLIEVKDGKVKGYGRNGQRALVRSKLEAQLQRLKGEWVFDGELVDKEYWIFDLLMAADDDLRDQCWLHRQIQLEDLSSFMPEMEGINFLRCYGSTEHKQQLFDTLSKSGEGVVFNKVYATITTKRASFKYKFVKTVDCVVTGEQHEVKNNFVLSVYKDGEPFECGHVSANTPQGGRIKIGDVVEVRCLYVSNSFRLYQPRKPKIRTDKAPRECLFDQLEVLQTNREVVML